ncbi:MAG: sigma-70 family RNA polymerase sigma factor [Minicystis sp.]
MTVDLLGNEGARRQQHQVNSPLVSPASAPDRPSSTERVAEHALFKVAHAYVLHSLHRLGLPRRDRPDLAQEILVAAYIRRSGYQPERGAPATWIRAFLTNAARNYRRKQARHQRLLRDDLMVVHAVASRPDDERSTTEEQRRILIDELLPRVPFEQRVIVIARDLDELEMTVIAEQEQISLSTAYDRYQRGRAALDRACAAWQSRQKDHGMLLAPLGLVQLFEADRAIPPAPADAAQAAFRRFRRARPWERVRAFLRQPAVRSAQAWIGGAVIGAVLHAALAPRAVAPAPILPVATVVAAGTGSAEPEQVAATTSSTVAPSGASTLEVSLVVAAPSAPASVATAAAPRDARSSYQEEKRAFEVAHRAFDRGDFGAARAALLASERASPRGSLVTERELLWVKVLVKSEKSSEARARLDRLRGSAEGRALAEQLDAFVPKGAGAAPAR